jgi:hypothetical protein
MATVRPGEPADLERLVELFIKKVDG